jgi:hypothetical protein
MKFDSHGNALPYPGNTVICDVDPDSPEHRALVRLQNGLRTALAADAFAFLPADSFHMTLYRGVNHLRRLDAEWPGYLDQETPLDAVTAEFAARLAPLKLPESFRMRPVALYSNPTGESQLRLEGATAAEKKKLHNARWLIRDALQHARPGEDDYAFHITFSYRVRPLASGETIDLNRRQEQLFKEFARDVPMFAVGAPTLCDYNDMLAFRPVLRLSPQP